MTTTSVRRAALGGIVGPATFVAAWSVLGAVKARYSPLHDPISDLAGVHASTRPAVTAGFVGFSVGRGLYSGALRSELPGPAWRAEGASAPETHGGPDG